MTYQAYHDETPVFTSAVPARGWEKVTTLPEGAASEADGHLWATEIPEGVKDFKVMFDGNRMLERARSRGFQSPQQEFKKFATRNVALPEDRPLLREMLADCQTLLKRGRAGEAGSVPELQDHADPKVRDFFARKPPPEEALSGPTLLQALEEEG